MADPKSEFKNISGGYIGVQVRNAEGRMHGIAVRPDATIWLTEDEQIATANAPQRDEDNPFIEPNLALKLVTPATKIANRRQIGFTEETQIDEVRSGATPEPEGDAASNGGGEDSAPGESEEPAAEKPEREPTQAEIDEANAKAAAARAIRQPAPAAPQRPEETSAAPKPAGKAAEGKRAPTEQVGTPEALKKG